MRIAIIVAVLVFFSIGVIQTIRYAKKPAMVISHYNRTPGDMVDQDYRNANPYPDGLITSTAALLEKHPVYHNRAYAYLIHGKRSADYSYNSCKTKDNLIVEYNFGNKLAIYTNVLPSNEMMRKWRIGWVDQPYLPQRIR